MTQNLIPKPVSATPSEGAFELTLSSQHDVLFLSEKPDIVLLALGNPGIEDLKLMDSLLRKWHGTPILALTRAEVPGQEQAALAHGAHAVLTKSVSREELLNGLRAIKTSSQIALHH